MRGWHKHVDEIMSGEESFLVQHLEWRQEHRAIATEKFQDMGLPSQPRGYKGLMRKFPITSVENISEK